MIEDLRKNYIKWEREQLYSLITSWSPYRQPEGYWFDTSWMIDSDGNLTLREISIMPGYLLEEECPNV